MLHLTPECPSPAGTGGAVRQWQLLRAVAARGHEVRVAAPVTAAQEETAGALPAAGIGLHAVRRPPSRAGEALRALGRRPGLVPAVITRPLLAWQVGVFWAALRPVAQRVVAQWRPDLLVVEHDYASSWLRDLDGAPAAVLVLQNVSWDLVGRDAGLVSGVRAGALRLDAARHLRAARRDASLYARRVAVSERDRHLAATVAPGPIDVVPNGVDVEALRPRPDPGSGPPTLIFTGTMNYGPNADGIAWFAREAWPRVVRARPDARLLVVGRDPPPQVRALARDRAITVTGAVEDIAPWFARSHVAVVPIRRGGGTRLKVLEALAAGRPVVSTRVGAEGLALGPDEVLLADEPETIAQAVLALLADPEDRTRRAVAGRSAVEARYGWPALGAHFSDVLERAAGAN